MALGAQHTQVLAVCGAVAALSAGLLWYGAEPLRARPAATTLVLVALGLLAWTALQAIPLPRGLVAVISPQAADVWARALTPLKEDGPAFVTLSLDPTATRIQVLRGVTYLLTFVAALRVAHRPAGIAFLERAIIVAGLAMATAAILHPVFGAQKVFGAYQPGEAYAYAPRHIAPLLNANHLGGYVTIGALVALSASVRRTETMPRLVAIVVTLLLIGANLWASSRGATAALVLGVPLTIGFAVGARRRERGKLLTGGLVVGVVVVAIFMIVLSSSDEARDELAQTDMSKLAVVKNALALLGSFPIFGIGRGAFESVFPSVREGTGYIVFTHPENVVAQWLTEWGAPVAVAALVACAWALRPQTALARSQPPVGAWAALAALAVHNLVDFNSEIPGVMVALTVCAAVVTGGSGGTPKESRVERWSRRPNAIAVAGAVAAAVSIVLTVPFASGELYPEERSLKDVAVDRSLPRDVAHARLRAAMLRHPAEAYFPFLGAVRALVAHDENVIPWAARALERSPVYGRAHLVLARYLYRISPSHARVEYRLAAEQDPGVYAAAEAAGLVRNRDDALEIAPAGKAGAVVLDGISAAIDKRLPATAAQLDREVVARDPSALAPARRAAASILADMKNHEPWCDPSRACLDEGLAAASRIQKVSPDGCEGYAFAAELRAAAGDVDVAMRDLERATERVTDRSLCARRLVSLALDTKRTQQADAALDRLVKMGCEVSSECADNLAFAASVEQQRGNHRRALADYTRAAERAVDPTPYLASIAQIASAEGLHGEALDAYTKLAARKPGEPQWTEGIAREKAALQAGLYAPRP
jgi:tetratricopeptide (TPR) repeat protein